MKKLKILWKSNKIIIILGFILLLCFIGICFVAATYFFGGDSSIYGDRLQGIEEHAFEDKDKNDYINTLKENESVKEVTVDIRGKMLYIHIDFIKDVTLEDAKVIAEESVTNFNEDILNFYEINFVMESVSSEELDAFIILGGRNPVTEGFYWNNNTIIEEEPVEDGEDE